MDQVQKSVYYEIKTSYFIRNYKLRDAIYTLEQLKNTCVLKVVPMYYLNSSTINFITGNLVESIEDYYKCIQYFSSSCNEEKMLWASTIRIQQLIQLKNFDKAHKLIDQVIESAKKREYNEVGERVLGLRALCLLLERKYEEILSLYYDLSKGIFLDGLFPLLYSLFVMDDFQRFIELVEIRPECKENHLISSFVVYLLSRFEKQPMLIINEKAAQMMDLLYETCNMNYLGYFLTIHSDYLYALGEYQQIILLQRKYKFYC